MQRLDSDIQMLLVLARTEVRKTTAPFHWDVEWHMRNLPTTHAHQRSSIRYQRTSLEWAGPLHSPLHSAPDGETL